MREFINFNGTNDLCSFEEGLNVMRIIDICEKSNKQKKEICLD